ncbi:complex I assembly factor TIMMDC1, mitochondrial [Notechis scutatus]|uniref:Complex I assembly factor TIMMDC1, mitochondrial n=1 Tax=Notechis scutatus TaxID=8663 RepID=A0A6J1TTQ3_9SAUR|nr:complex I assembly factor TIMMDC1, mitochondrial [Notechis scutatus]XP_026519859.1 complex I assembly factor TIMMDC1, mitochondrial [Notechis scutatus]XP_026519860.1 complex I assembly factor TIMMDC1, mitochondrial [Notechis scutatus]
MERPGERTACPLTGLGEENAAPDSEPLGALEGSPPWLQPPNSGWERIRELFRRNDQKEYPEESLHIVKAAFTGSLVGFVYGGIPGYLNAKKQYIEQCEGELYHNRLDAVQSMQRSAIRGFIRYGWRWSWRVAAFVAIFNTVNTCLSVYRGKSTLGHYTIAGACTGSLFRMQLGLRGLIGGSVIGGLLGGSLGTLLMGLQKVSGETFIERKKRTKSELHALKMAKWEATLDILEDISEGTDNILQEKDGR